MDRFATHSRENKSTEVFGPMGVGVPIPTMNTFGMLLILTFAFAMPIAANLTNDTAVSSTHVNQSTPVPQHQTLDWLHSMFNMNNEKDFNPRPDKQTVHFWSFAVIIGPIILVCLVCKCFHHYKKAPKDNVSDPGDATTEDKKEQSTPEMEDPVPGDATGKCKCTSWKLWWLINAIIGGLIPLAVFTSVNYDYDFGVWLFSWMGVTSFVVNFVFALPVFCLWHHYFKEPAEPVIPLAAVAIETPKVETQNDENPMNVD